MSKVPWSDAELADLVAGKLTNAEMSRKYGRSYDAVKQKRSKMGLLVIRTTRASSQKFPLKPVTPPGCSYCSGHVENPCTCDAGDKCRDPNCLYYVRAKR